MQTDANPPLQGRDRTDELAARIREAFAAVMPLAPVGGGSKAFFGPASTAAPLSLADHAGVVSYEPSELVLTARAGTPLACIEALLAEQGQMIASEPPHFGGGATLGGAVAAGWSGPRRPWAGALRDHVLGVRVLDGRGRVCRFGGEVMKNVAGYDVARLMTGSLGTLGVILEVSLKVLPRPGEVRTLLREEPAARLHACVLHASRRGIPLTAAAHEDGVTRLRVAGPHGALEAAARELGGDRADVGYWERLRDHRLAFFRLAPEERLWRVSLPAHASLDSSLGAALIDWGGRLHWIRSEAPPARVHRAAAALGGHATLWRGGRPAESVLAPWESGVRKLHQRLKAAFDPAGILNPGRMDPGW